MALMTVAPDHASAVWWPREGRAFFKGRCAIWTAEGTRSGQLSTAWIRRWLTVDDRIAESPRDILYKLAGIRPPEERLELAAIEPDAVVGAVVDLDVRSDGALLHGAAAHEAGSDL
jgi:hypothetical protein